MNENNANFTPAAPNFKTLVRMSFQGLTNFPYIEEDFDALTNYGLLSKVVEYLNQVISNNNEQNTLMTNLYNAYVSLQDYINNYFDNLDVTDEINNKLDNMAQDGTLTSLIKNYVDPFILQQNQRIDAIDTKVDAVTSGSPLVASSVDGMTDTNRIYVNTSNGYWYYYDGDSWEQGGVYQSSGISDNSVTPNMLQNVECYNLYNTEEIEFHKLGGNYQRLIVPAKPGEIYGAFRRMSDGTIIRSYAGNGYNSWATLIYFFDNKMTDPDNTVGRIQVNVNPTENVTAPENTAYVVLYIVNATDNIYMPNDFLFCEMTNKSSESLQYYPYGYFFKYPYIIDYSDGLKERLESIENSSPLFPHKGKKILGLGDSYTFLNYYGKYLEDETKVLFTPRGYNGASIKYFVNDYYTPTGGDGTPVSNPITQQLLNQYDAVTVMGGTNNYGQSIQPLGTINDEIGANTVHGDIKYVINYLLTRKSDIEIIWCTEPFRLSYSQHPAPGGYEPNSQGYTMQDVANAIIEECEHYGLPCYDFYSNSQWNSYSVRRENNVLVENKFTYDGLHPKDGDGNGADLLGRSFGAFINNVRF